MIYILRHSDDELYHFGILGQKWGIRRFQNKDGTYTSEGLLRKRKSDGISRKEVKKIVRDYNTIHGTNHKYNKHTIVTKKGSLYDYKGRKLDKNSGVYASGNKFFKKRKSPLDSKSIDELTEMYQKEKLKNDISSLTKKNASLGEQFIDDLKRSSMQGVSSGIGQGISTAITRAVALDADKAADAYRFNRRKAEDAYDDARSAANARRRLNETIAEYEAEYNKNRRDANAKYAESQRNKDAEYNDYIRRQRADASMQFAWDTYNDSRSDAGKNEWDRWNGGGSRKKKKKK